MDTQKQQSINVLKAWHLVEFFQAYSVPDKEDSVITPVNISYHELKSQGDALLPWLNPECKYQLGIDPSPQKKCTYTLYLGLFDKAVVDKKVAEYFAQNEHESFVQDEIEQRRDNEGLTCFAKLMLDEFGAPRLDTFSISTLPWALAELLAGRGKDISQASFDNRCDDLVDTLDKWLSNLTDHPQRSGKITLTAADIDGLVRDLYSWAGLSTHELKLTETSTVNMLQMAFFESDVKQEKSKESNEPSQAATEDDSSDDEEEEKESEDSQLPILNSFYIRDLEKAINAIYSGSASSPLRTYLQNSADKHVDLYTNQAMELIHSHLSPVNTPEGRWLTEPVHNMSLMQQFAINTAFKDLKQGGLISVNGPPGTGKTTLLRDVIAQNIVERAKVLSSFTRAKDGLTADGLLIDSLTGFEMVVASSNNAAVENISKELPQLSSLGNSYADISFLRPIANQVSAGEKKGVLQPLNEDKQVWGNISAVLGAKKKREKFLERLFFKSHYEKGNEPEEREPSADFLNFWQFRKSHLYKGLSFRLAKEIFNEKLEAYQALNQELIDFHELNETLASGVYENKCEELRQQLAEFEGLESTLLAEFDALKNNRDLNQIHQSEILVSIERLKLNEPGFFSRLFKPQKNTVYREELSKKLAELEAIKRSFRLLESELMEKGISKNELKKKVTQIVSDIAGVEGKLQTLKKQLCDFEARFQEYHFPKQSDVISDESRQRNACWQNKDINQLRSDVFAAALKLHEAWLVEATRTAAFREQVMKINDVVLAKPHCGAVPVSIWQILFMIVPVVSTTFASLGRMFTALPPESLGWLMIDEAGQAIPQAAVGGLLRAKKAIVVGDPLQIEPVFTSPPELVDYLTSSVLEQDKDDWNPCLWSVQTLADRVNPYGCMLEVEQTEKWIGIPLWVHRRCIEPMFSIANRIAYNNRMIHGSSDPESVKPKFHPQLGMNKWHNSQGDCVFKQYKYELGKEVISLLVEIANSGGDLNKVYVISPFKAVKNRLKEDLRGNGHALLQLMGWGKKQFSDFVKNNIGTVHTFQGKENDTVILVLGCDSNNEGGAVWASSKPNLLNVAVTRAKKHLFIIGDSNVWCGKPHFNKAYQALAQHNLSDKSEQTKQQQQDKVEELLT